MRSAFKGYGCLLSHSMNSTLLQSDAIATEISRGQNEQCPVYVDLDGTLIRSDLLIESAVKLARLDPFSVPRMLAWWWQGRATLKAQIAKRVGINAACLPYDAQVLTYIREMKAQGRRIVLATASDRKFAEAVAAHLDVFDAVLASDGETNLSGVRKLAAIQKDAGGHFCYIGNSRVDLPIWEKAAGAVVVTSDAGLARRAASLTRVEQQIIPRRLGLAGFFKAIRIHQWAKNILLAMPFLPIARQLQPSAWGALLVGFVCFGLCASSVYLINDLLDLEADRMHPRKRRRALASGVMPLSTGLLLAPLFLVAGFVLAALIEPWPFIAVLAGYWLCTLAYSLRLKRHMVMDVTVLAGLYTLRILAGSAIVMIVPSFWILAFSIFIFHSLACLKRVVELQDVQQRQEKRASGRGYFVSDKPLIQMQGVATGMMSVLVFALYINDPVARAHFSQPYALWALCPLLLFWISRTWVVSARGELHDDPVVFALKDRMSRIIGVLALVALLAATYL
jgi:4-hydroxybenzoate polyprenyltransferase/phosphoserine phosphatase